VACREYLDYWLEHVVRISNRPATYDLYEVMVRVYLRPGLGRHRLNRLTVSQVQTFLNERAALGDSPRKIQIIRTVLSSALTRAMREELVSRNVARLVTVAEAPSREAAPWSPAEVGRFLRAAADDPLYAGFVMLFYLGLRRGEVLGLAWDDIDWASETITVRWQGQRSAGRLQRRPVKTRAGRRELPLLEVVRDALIEQQDRQGAWRSAAAPAWRDSGLVLTTKIGTQVEPRNFNRTFARICRSAELRSFRPHDARHTCASLLGQLSIDPRTAMEILGHSRSSVTLEVYQRASDETRRAALARVSKRLTSGR